MNLKKDVIAKEAGINSRDIRFIFGHDQTFRFRIETTKKNFDNLN